MSYDVILGFSLEEEAHGSNFAPIIPSLVEASLPGKPAQEKENISIRLVELTALLMWW